MTRILWRLLGVASVAIGLINAFIPLLPTTVFLLIGVWAYGRGDPALRDKLLHHPRFGHALRMWVENRQLSRKNKIAACCGIALSASITTAMIGTQPITWVILFGLAGLCVYLASRQEPGPS